MNAIFKIFRVIRKILKSQASRCLRISCLFVYKIDLIIQNNFSKFLFLMFPRSLDVLPTLYCLLRDLFMEGLLVSLLCEDISMFKFI